MRDFDSANVSRGSDSVIRRRRLNVRFARKRTRLSDLRVRALISATAPPLRSVARPRPRRPAESEPLAASRRSPIPATVSIAEEARGRRGPRRGRSSALARSIGLDQPKKRGRGAGQISARPSRSRARCNHHADICNRFARVLGGCPRCEYKPGSGRSPADRARVAGGRGSVGVDSEPFDGGSAGVDRPRKACSRRPGRAQASFSGRRVARPPFDATGACEAAGRRNRRRPPATLSGRSP